MKPYPQPVSLKVLVCPNELGKLCDEGQNTVFAQETIAFQKNAIEIESHRTFQTLYAPYILLT